MRIHTEESLKTARMLREFFSAALGDELDGFEFDIRRAPEEDALEFHVDFQYHGCVYIKSERLKDAEGMTDLKWEARALLRMMRKVIVEIMNGEHAK